MNSLSTSVYFLCSFKCNDLSFTRSSSHPTHPSFCLLTVGMLLIALAKVKETLNNAKNVKTARRRLRLGMYQLVVLKDAGGKVTDSNGGGS